MAMIDELNTATRKYIMPALVNQVWKETVLLDRLTRKERTVDGGTKLRVNLEYGTGASGGSYSKTDVLNITPTKIMGAAEFDWAHYWAGNAIYKLDDLENKGKSQIVNLLVAKMKNIQHQIREDVETDLFAAQTGTKVLSLVDAIKYATTPTYGGIDRSVAGYEWFRGNVTAVGGILTYSVMESMYNTCKEIPHKPPDLIVTTKALFEYYWKLKLDKVGWLNQDANVVSDVVPFGTAELTYSPHCAAGDMWFLNTDHIFLAPNPDDNFEFSGWESVLAATGQRRLDGRVFWTGNLASDMPIANGVLTGLTTS